MYLGTYYTPNFSNSWEWESEIPSFCWDAQGHFLLHLALNMTVCFIIHKLFITQNSHPQPCYL